MKFFRYLLLITILGATQLAADEVDNSELLLEDLAVTEAWIREVPKGHPTTAGYAKITNSGNTDQKLTHIRADFAKMSKLHLMKEEYGIMRMIPIMDGVLIPAHSTLSLEPGGLHIMFIKLNTSLILSEKHTIYLTFENIGDTSVAMTVKNISATSFHSVD